MAITRDELAQGQGWTPGRVWKLRDLLGSEGKPIRRVDLAAGISSNEWSIMRWEQGARKPMPASRQLLSNYALANLTPDALEALLAYDGEAMLKEAV